MLPQSGKVTVIKVRTFMSQVRTINVQGGTDGNFITDAIGQFRWVCVRLWMFVSTKKRES